MPSIVLNLPESNIYSFHYEEIMYVEEAYRFDGFIKMLATDNGLVREITLLNNTYWYVTHHSNRHYKVAQNQKFYVLFHDGMHDLYKFKAKRNEVF